MSSLFRTEMLNVMRSKMGPFKNRLESTACDPMSPLVDLHPYLHLGSGLRLIAGCVFFVCVSLIGEWADFAKGGERRGRGGVWPFFKHSRVVMVARALKLPNLQLGGSYFGLLTLEKAMTSRLGDLLNVLN